MGVVIDPPVPAFYHHPRSIDDLVDHTVQRVLDLFGIHLDVPTRWSGTMAVAGPAPRRSRPRSATPLRVAAAGRRKQRDE